MKIKYILHPEKLSEKTRQDLRDGELKIGRQTTQELIRAVCFGILVYLFVILIRGF